MNKSNKSDVSKTESDVFTVPEVYEVCRERYMGSGRDEEGGVDVMGHKGIEL
jgi:hypothetical protein